MLAPNSILQNRYRVVRLLGKGGMGAVYEAIDQRVSCVVALKETLVGENSEARRAFEREAALLANLRHPVLPKVMDYFSEGNGEFLVMEFIPGYDLAELIEISRGAFPESQVLDWADEILKLLEFLHSKEPPILHRDIKPSNLKVTRDGEVFLLDFGLAKGATGQMSTLDSGRSVGGYTPLYASLEQIHGRGTDVRSDIYSLGATLYHLLTGQPPSDAPTRFTLIDEEGKDPLVPAHVAAAGVSTSVSAAISKAMAMTRRERFASATEMRRALAQARQLEAKRPSAPTAPKLNEPVAPPLPTAPAPDLLNHKIPSKDAGAREVEKPTPPLKTISQMPGLLGPNTNPHQPTPTAELHTPNLNSRRNHLPWIILGVLLVFSIPAIGLILWFGGSTPETLNTPAGSVNPSAPKNYPTAPANMVYVPGGEFIMGRDDGDEYERPAHKVSVKPFFIDVHEVTLSDYDKFVRTNREHGTPGYLAAITFDPNLETTGNDPVTGARWDNAIAYCQWAGKRLPTEQEWEFAARGTDGRRYPWGNEWQSGLANAHSAKANVSSVGSFKGASPFGVKDMVGNAWEWTATQLTAYPGGQLPIKPPDDLRIIRGGSYESTREQATTTYRGYLARRNANSYDQTGFRCVRDVN